MIVHRSQVHPGLALVRVEGEVDLTTADALSEAIISSIVEWKPKEIQVDLVAVPFMDSMGISALLAGYQAAADTDVVFRVVDASRGLLSVLRLTGLLDIFGYQAPAGYEPPHPYEQPPYEPPSSSIAR